MTTHRIPVDSRLLEQTLSRLIDLIIKLENKMATVADLESKIDTLAADYAKAMTALNVKIDTLTANAQANVGAIPATDLDPVAAKLDAAIAAVPVVS